MSQQLIALETNRKRALVTHSRFPPEEKELLCSPHLAVVDRHRRLTAVARGAVLDAGLEKNERDR